MPDGKLTADEIRQACDGMRDWVRDQGGLEVVMRRLSTICGPDCHPGGPHA